MAVQVFTLRLVRYVLAGGALLVGCNPDSARKSTIGESCSKTEDCAGVMRCVDQKCVAEDGLDSVDIEAQIEHAEKKGKPTTELCTKFADKFVSLSDARGPLGDELRQELIDSCVKGGTREEVDCVLQASSMAEVERDCQM